MDVEDACQLRLAPEAPLVGEARSVPLASIRPPAARLGAPPELVRSIRSVGLLQPLLLVPTDGRDDYLYQVVEGARRWDALTQVAVDDPSRDTVPALVVGLDGWQGLDILSATANERRGPNIVQLLETLERLYAGGATPSQVHQATGMSPQRQRRVWRLHGLIPDLRAAVTSRQVTQAVAESAARLSAEDQASLAASGRVTAETVRAKRLVERSAAIEHLFADLDDIGEDDVPGTSRPERAADTGLPAPAELGLTSDAPGWKVAAVDAVRRGLAAVPPSECVGVGGGTSILVMCLVQAAVSLGVNPASRYEILLTLDQRAALRGAGWDEPGSSRRRAS